MKILKSFNKFIYREFGGAKYDLVQLRIEFSKLKGAFNASKSFWERQNYLKQMDIIIKQIDNIEEKAF